MSRTLLLIGSLLAMAEASPAEELADYMRGAGDGQQTFDQDLLTLFRRELITPAEALRHASNPEALSMTLRGIGSSSAVTEPGHAGAAAKTR